MRGDVTLGGLATGARREGASIGPCSLAAISLAAGILLGGCEALLCSWNLLGDQEQGRFGGQTLKRVAGAKGQ